MQLPLLDFALAAGKHQTNYFHLWSAICKYSYYVLTKFDKGKVRPVKNTLIYLKRVSGSILMLLILNINHVTLIQEKFDFLQIKLFQPGLLVIFLQVYNDNPLLVTSVVC